MAMRHKNNKGTFLATLIFLYGFCGYNKNKGIDLVVFGESKAPLLRKTSHFKSIQYLEISDSDRISSDSLGIPDMYEPMVWIYSFQNGSIRLKAKGMLGLLK